MKLKVKISAMEHGKIVKFNHTFDTPDFEASDFTFLDQQFHESVVQKQTEWLDDNYHLVVEQCEQRFLYPILGYDVVVKRQKSDKKEQIIAILSELKLSDELLGTALGTLATLWPDIKQLSVERILTILFKSVDISHDIATYHLREINERIKNPKRRPSCLD